MSNKEQLIQAINEAVQQAIPSIVESVSARLEKNSQLKEKNKTKSRKEWENLSVSDLITLSKSEYFVDRCRAATHPNLPTDIIVKLANDPDGKVRRAVRMNPNFDHHYTSESIDGFPIPSDAMLKTMDITAYIKCLQRFGPYKGMTPIPKSHRKRIRTALEERILKDNIVLLYESEAINLWEVIFDYMTPINRLAELTNHQDYNVSYFANVVLKTHLKSSIDNMTDTQKAILQHFIKNDLYTLRSALNDIH